MKLFRHFGMNIKTEFFACSEFVQHSFVGRSNNASSDNHDQQNNDAEVSMSILKTSLVRWVGC